ncbi:hypothetical protein [Robiginitalea biformata]|uniref:hypothetical protein n=1 Tax=Robiginitalea biformata TaxID=252307 RepID=UPI003B599386
MEVNPISLLLKYPFLPVYLVTVFLAIWRYPRYFDTLLRLLPVLFTYTLATEILGIITYEFTEFSIFLNEFFSYYNWLIYNVYLLIFCGYFFFVYYRVIPWRAARTAILIGSALLAIAALINPLYQSFQYEVQLGTYITGSAVLVVSSMMYLIYRRSVSGRAFTDRDLLSWISLGIAIFYSGFIPITIYRNMHAPTGLMDPVVVTRILQVLIFVMYGCILVGLWRMRPQRVFLSN